MPVIGEEFVRIRPETSQFTPELQAAINAAINVTEGTAEEIDVGAGLAPSATGELTSETAALVQAVESSTEEIDVGAGLARDALPSLQAQAAAVVQGVESSVEEIDVGAGLSPAALPELQAQTAAAVQAVESTTETIDVKVGLNEATVAKLKAEANAAATSASGSFGSIIGTVGPAGVAIAGLAGAAALSVTQFTRLTEQVRDFSAVTGASLEQSSRIVEVFDDLGFNADTAEKAFFLLNKNIANGSDALERYGVATVTANDGSVDYIETLLSISQAYQNAGSDSERTGILFSAFGRAGAQLAPILNQNTDALRAMFAAVSDEKIIGQDDIDSAQDLRLAFDSVVDAVQGLLLPAARALTPLLSSAAGALGPVVSGLGTVLKFIGPDLVGALTSGGIAVLAFRKALDGVALSSASAGLAMSSFSGALGAASAALVGFNIGTALGKQIFGDYANDVAKLTDAMAGLTDEASKADFVFRTLNEGTPGLTDTLAGLGITLADLTAGLGTNSAEIGFTVGKLQEARDAGKLSEIQYQAILGQLQLLDDAYNSNQERTEAVAVATGELTGATGELTEETEALTSAYELQLEQINLVTDALNESISPILTARDAKRDLAEKTQAYTDALKEEGRASPITKAAFDDLVESALANVEAHVGLTDATESATEIQDLNLAALRRLARQHPENEGLVRLLIKAMKEVPPETVTTPKFPTAEAKKKIDELVGELNAINKRVAARQLGADIMLGIAAGMTANEQFAVAAAEKAVSRAIAAARAAAGAASPSKKMAALGRDMIDGLLEGLEDRGSAADARISGFVSNTIATFSDRFKSLKERGSPLHFGALQDQLDAFAKQGSILSENLTDAIGVVTERVGKLVDSVQQGIISSGALADVSKGIAVGAGPQGGELLIGFQARLDQARAFSAQLADLAAQGLDTDILQQLAQQGPGEEAAKLMAEINSAGVKNINAVQTELEKLAEETANIIGTIVLPREKLDAGVAEAAAEFEAFMDKFRSFVKRLDEKLDKQSDKIRELEKDDKKPGQIRASLTQHITVNEVANDPRATAAAVSARLGAEATR